MTIADFTRVDPSGEGFYRRAMLRIRWLIVILGVTGAVFCFLLYPLAAGLGFVLGAFLSYTNHVWLERVITALGERITTGGSTERGGVIVARAVLRYAFLAAGAYVIFRVSLVALFGFLAGVCLTIAAVFCEVIFEIYQGLRAKF